MKVAVVSVHGCPCIPPGGLDAGGMNVYVRETSDKLAELGHEVTVFARHHAVTQIARMPMHRAVELVHIPAGEFSATKEQIGDTLPEFTDLARKWVAGHRRGFDVLAAHYWFSGVVAISLAAELSVPLVFSYHTMAATKLAARAEEQESRTRLTAEREIAQAADRIVAWTQEEVATIRREHSVPANRVVVSSPGVDCGRFAPKPVEDEGSVLESQARGANIGYVGRLDAFKGIETVLSAFAAVAKRVPSARLLVAGDGNDEQSAHFRREAGELGIGNAVKWLGVVPYDEMPGFYRSIDVLLAPSFHETFGLAALEAAASGVPVVAADVDGLRAIVEDGATGYLVRGRNPDDYARLTLDILGDAESRRRMSESGRERALSRSWAAVARDLEAIYSSVFER